MLRELISKVVDRLGEIGCPYCHYTSFSVALRCEPSSGEACALVAECQQCSMKFGLGSIDTIGELHMRAEQELASQLCPCGESPCLELLCNLKTEHCHFVAACPICGSHSFIVPAEAQTLVA